MGESAMNPDLQELFDTLESMAAKLSRQLGEAATIDEAQKILGQIMEVNHRQTRTGALLFTQKTSAIAKAMDKVRSQTNAANQAIAKIDDLQKFLKTVSSFLALVDKVIDTADLVKPGL
jgi:cell fate (sporulation/competence/biofilm development) regulator YmcA (YheA/YmcA/DUF963 family)